MTTTTGTTTTTTSTTTITTTTTTTNSYYDDDHNNNSNNNNNKERTKTGAPFQQQLLAFVSFTRLETKPGAPCVVLRGGRCCSSFPVLSLLQDWRQNLVPRMLFPGWGLLFRCCSAVVPHGLCLYMGRSNKAWCPVCCSGGGGGVVLEGAGGGAGPGSVVQKVRCDKRSQCT